MRSRLAVRRFLERARRQVRSQDQIAELVSSWGYPVSRPAVGFWLQGRTDPPSWVMFALAEELQLPLNDFVAGQSWNERLTAVEVQLAELMAWAATQGKQATFGPMTTDSE